MLKAILIAAAIVIALILISSTIGIISIRL